MCQKATLSESSSVGPYISDALQECNKEMHDKKIHGELNDVYPSLLSHVDKQWNNRGMFIHHR